jgi:hypothetical protein
MPGTVVEAVHSKLRGEPAAAGTSDVKNRHAKVDFAHPGEQRTEIRELPKVRITFKRSTSNVRTFPFRIYREE